MQPLAEDRAQRVLVVLPTYRRAEALVWSLSSVLLQRFEFQPPVSAHVVVVNNDRGRVQVDEAVRSAMEATGAGTWSVEVLHRDPPLDPVLSWYGAIAQFARPGDVVFLHGDDDLMVRGSLAVRSQLLLKTEATLLSTRSRAGLLFDPATPDQAHLGQDLPFESRLQQSAPTVATPGDVQHGECTFIGNHAYRMDGSFWPAYQAVLTCVESLPISGPNQRAMLPLLLAVELAAGGRLVLSDFVGVLRGQSKEELFGARWGVANWSTGIMLGTVLRALDSPPWAHRMDLEGLRRAYRAQVARWYCPTLLDPNARTQLRALGIGTVPWSGGRLLPELLQGAGITVKGMLGLRGLKTRLGGHRHVMGYREWLALMQKDEG